MGRIAKCKIQMVEAMVSIRADGAISFDDKAVAAFAGRGIEFVSFHDERMGWTTGRFLTSAERRALRERARTDPVPGEVKGFGDFLREIGMKTRRNRRYKARWWDWASYHIIVRIK
jgi:hypothetical protein